MSVDLYYNLRDLQGQRANGRGNICFCLGYDVLSHGICHCEITLILSCDTTETGYRNSVPGIFQFDAYE